MGRIMNRDKELIKFLDESQVILTTEEIADLFYTASTKNSSITIARRRLKILSELGYINCIKGSMGESNKFCSISYTHVEPNKHQKMINDFIVNFCLNFDVEKIIKEYSYFREIYSLQCDIRIDFNYKGYHLTALIECDRTKNFTSLDKYTKVLKNINEYKNELPYDVIVIAHCKKTPDHNVTCNPIHVVNMNNLSPVKKYIEQKYDIQVNEIEEIKKDIEMIKKEIAELKKSH